MAKDRHSNVTVSPASFPVYALGTGVYSKTCRIKILSTAPFGLLVVRWVNRS